MPFRSVHGGTAFLIPASLKIPYLGKVCRSFGHGLKNDGRPCPWKSSCRSLHGRLGGQGLQQKNRLCPNIGQTLPTTITDLAHNLSWLLSDTEIKPPNWPARCPLRAHFAPLAMEHKESTHEYVGSCSMYGYFARRKTTFGKTKTFFSQLIDNQH